MIIIWGQSNYGKVDVVPNLFYVATRFFHLYYVPLIPLATYLIVAGTEDENGSFQGVKLPMSLRSVLAGWVRAVLVLCIVAGLGTALVMGIEAAEGKVKQNSTVAIPLILAVFSAVG